MISRRIINKLKKSKPDQKLNANNFSIHGTAPPHDTSVLFSNVCASTSPNRFISKFRFL